MCLSYRAHDQINVNACLATQEIEQEVSLLFDQIFLWFSLIDRCKIELLERSILGHPR